MARLSRKHCPLLRRSRKPSEKWRSSVPSSCSLVSFWEPTRRSAVCGPRGGVRNGAEKKTIEAIRQEITREVEEFLRVVFEDRRKTGRLDLEATEMAMRSALHRAGAAALSQLLEFPAPTEEGRTQACPSAQPAH